MGDEYDAIIKTGTFYLVSRPANVNIVHSIWLCKKFFNADGSFKKHKSRLVEMENQKRRGQNSLKPSVH